MSTAETFSDAVDLDALARGIEWASGIAFFFLVVDDPRLREQAIADVERRLQRRTVRRLTILRETKSLRAEIRTLPKLDAQDLLVVTGIENLVRDENDTDVPLIHNLNVTRDALGRIAPCPILFLVPRFVLRVLEAGAPDFFSTRSAVYVYVGQAEEQPWEREMPAFVPAGTDLSEAAKIERIGELEEMLTVLPKLRLGGAGATGIYLRIAERLIGLLMSRYDLKRARTIALEAYEIAQATSPTSAVRFAWALAKIADRLEDLEALESYANQTENLATQINDDESKVRALEVRGLADAARRNDNAALESLKTALILSEKIGWDAMSARLEGEIANLIRRDGNAIEAIERFNHARLRAEEVGDAYVNAAIRMRLALTLLQVGRVREAEEAAKISAQEFERLDNTPELSVALDSLGDVLAAQGRWEEAESIFQRSFEIAIRSPAPEFAVWALFGLIDVKRHMGDRDAAIKLIQDTLALIDEFRADIREAADAEDWLRRQLAQLQSAP